MAGDTGKLDPLRQALARVEALRSDTIDLAREIATAEDGTLLQRTLIARVRCTLEALAVAEAAERRLIDDSPVAAILLSTLDSIPVTYRDESDLSEATARALEFSDQLVGLGALHRAESAKGMR